MREIFFELASLEDFLRRLNPLWINNEFSPQILGDNELAREISRVATQNNIALHSDDLLVASGKTPLIILTEENGAALHLELMSYLSISDVVIVAPVTDWHFSKRPLFLLSIPKSGTHLLYELAGALGFNPGVDLPEFPQGKTWYCVEYENSHTEASDFFIDTVRRSPFGNRHHSFMRSPAIFIYRHPLDILVSEAHYYHLDGKTAFAGWFDGLDFSSRVDRLLNDGRILLPFRDRIRKFLPWLEFPNVINLSFEELVGAAGGGSDAEQRDLIWSLLLKLQVPGNPDDVCAKLFNCNAATFRAGQIGSYRKELSSENIESFARQNHDILVELGFNVNGEAMLPSHRQRHRAQRLSYSNHDYHDNPIKLESGFLGCNLVRYAGRIYALPINAGALHMAQLSPEFLAALPSAATLCELKTLLLIGLEGLDQRLNALHKLGDALSGREALEGFIPFWNHANAPCLVEEYKGNNIVFFDNRFYGIRQSLGEVDLTKNLDTTLSSYSMDDVMVGYHILEIRDQIDRISSHSRLKQWILRTNGQKDVKYCQDKDSSAQALQWLSFQNSRAVEQLGALESELREARTAFENRSVAVDIKVVDIDRQLLEKISLTDDTLIQLRVESERNFLRLSHIVDDYVVSNSARLEEVLADQANRQECFMVELRKSIDSAHEEMQITLLSVLAQQQSELDRQAKLIAAMKNTWLLRLVHHVRHFMERKR